MLATRYLTTTAGGRAASRRAAAEGRAWLTCFGWACVVAVRRPGPARRRSRSGEVTGLGEVAPGCGSSDPGCGRPGAALPGAALPGAALPGAALPGAALPAGGGRRAWDSAMPTRTAAARQASATARATSRPTDLTPGRRPVAGAKVRTW